MKPEVERRRAVRKALRKIDKMAGQVSRYLRMEREKRRIRRSFDSTERFLAKNMPERYFVVSWPSKHYINFFRRQLYALSNGSGDP